MEELSRCPFCGERIVVRIAGGVHFYECQNREECGTCISFIGKKPCGVVNETPMYEAENTRERFNRRVEGRSGQ